MLYNIIISKVILQIDQVALMKTKKMVYSGFLAAVGVILPVIFHLFTQGAGRIFLPIHIPVLLAGFIVGPIGLLQLLWFL